MLLDVAVPSFFVSCFALFVGKIESLICDVGANVRAYKGLQDGDENAECTISQPECWSTGVIGDGLGRGDAFLTIIWHDRDLRNRRVHASYVIHTASGKPCASPFSTSLVTSTCVDDGCLKYTDSCNDLVGGVLWTGGKTMATCSGLANAGMCNHVIGASLIDTVSTRCPQTCGLCGPRRRCIALTDMVSKLQQYAQWGWYSQSNSDSAFHLLLVHPGGLFTPPEARFFVEFGYRPLGGRLGPDSNSEYLQRLGWRGIAFDITHDEPSRGLFQEEITKDNVVSIFQKHHVPKEPGIVMIDIDSCDVWVFLSLTKVFRPRMVQIEYSRFFKFDDNVTLNCEATDHPPVPPDSNIFGSSIHAIATAGKLRGYSVAWVVRCFDVILVRNDLVCPGTRLPDLEPFRAFTIHDGGCPDPWGYFANEASDEMRRKWLLDVGSNTFSSKGDSTAKRTRQ